MSNKSQFAQIEEEMLSLWEKEKTFQKVLTLRQEASIYSFYDGPPFASGQPHYGHIEQTAIKDAVARYKTMQGFRVPRRTGWDTHGLPVEYKIEQELGLKSKKDIVKYGVDKFNQACRDAVFRHKEEFDHMYQRMGRWMDPAETYATLDVNYMESVWWAFKQLYDKELVYRGYKSVAYCPRCATPLSNFEVNDGYKDDVADPSIYVKFKKVDGNGAFLAWTTTPWSLPANATLAVDPNEVYVDVKVDGEVLTLAKKRLAAVGSAEVLKEQTGQDLLGQKYQPLFEITAEVTKEYPGLYQVVGSSEVDVDDGTGILHVAPAYGELDLELGQKNKLPIMHSVDENGLMKEKIGIDGVAGQFFKKADKSIIEDLQKRDLVHKVDESFTHTYPFCWRCETPLLYYAINTWFVAVTKLQKKLLDSGKKTNWVPGHVKSGRFLNWLGEARDWAMSRNRFWGTPIPIWQTEDGEVVVVGSLEELRQRAVGNPSLDDLHRPGIDEVVIKTDSGKEAKRVTEVFDCWFESGSMPYAQDHYPFENEAKFKQSFPADFIVEAIEQVHLWFYTMHVLNTAIFDEPAFTNVIASGLIQGDDGRKLSKRLKNYPPFEEATDQHGADTLRFFLLSSPLMNGQDTRLSHDGLRDVQRNVFSTLWNVFSFFKTYTDIDNWESENIDLEQPRSDNVLDHWVLARLNQVTTEVTKYADEYRLDKATRPIVEFIDDLSNWYVRRSRRRFWKSEDDGDKEQAYQTLWYVLVRTSQLLAPWAPFLSDKIYRELATSSPAGGMPESVHLTDWPKGHKPDDSLIEQMATLRKLITGGLEMRAREGIKARQPLAAAILESSSEIKPELLEIAKDELNVKKIEYGKLTKEGSSGVRLATKITPELKREGLMREVVRHVQQFRKESGLEVADRISLQLETGHKDLKRAIDEHAETIKTETLATALGSKVDSSASAGKTVKVEDAQLEISLKKS